MQWTEWVAWGDSGLRSPFLSISTIIKGLLHARFFHIWLKYQQHDLPCLSCCINNTLCLYGVPELAKCFLTHHLNGFGPYSIPERQGVLASKFLLFRREVEAQRDKNLAEITGQHAPGPSSNRTGTKCKPPGKELSLPWAMVPTVVKHSVGTFMK